jgi:hypothetical protein
LGKTPLAVDGRGMAKVGCVAGRIASLAVAQLSEQVRFWKAIGVIEPLDVFARLPLPGDERRRTLSRGPS